ncbi:hypothetical protein [Parazoarcus communis]|uniref:Uncharacterized protein n=1 Tax=Parazoarcus communis SWub3 = DSM 12120 TaxID=1121029 RepID=A0A323VC63_9RHOO|nr:hypothetical protein [Parazoarcus communis]NMG68687.1 hypothetical protein [Parazoarcus communis SWub3 = DSM 12120]PZA17818.1 hypothetical protein DNK49_04645 [Azoarcus communis] [Parazoarcus communis SWub3 = DSM 12120]
MKSGTWVGLREFLPSELIFDDRETRDILKFFFPRDFQVIDASVITDAVRAFAQGLLIEAIDATAALGWVETLFRSTANPGAGVKQILRKLATSSAKRWFKNSKDMDLSSIKISEHVRNQLSRSFRFQLIGLVVSGRGGSIHRAYVCYGPYSQGERVWG